MKKFKKIIVLAMATVMLFGSTLSVNAATKCIRCGSYNVAMTSPAYGHCYQTTCYAPITFYACASCKGYWEVCSMGHRQ